MTRSAYLVALLVVMSAGAARGQLDPNAFSSLGTLSHPSGTLTINTDTLTITGGTTFTGVALSQNGGPQVAVFDFSSITIGSAATVTLTGSRPLALLSQGNATIQTPLTVPSSPAGTNPVLGGYAGGQASAATSINVGQAGGGPGGGGATADFAVAGGGGYGGNGGTTAGGLSGLAYGNLYQILQGGSGGGAVVESLGGVVDAHGGAGGGALEVVAAGTLAVANVSAFGFGAAGAAPGIDLFGAGGGAGGGILLSGRTGLTLNGTVDVAGGSDIANSGVSTSAGGGGRVVLSGLSSYTLGTSLSNPFVGGGTGASGGNGFAGVITVDALSTTVPSGTSVTLNGGPFISVAGSTTQTTPTMEAYARRDLVVNSGATVTLGMNNALQHLDASGNNVTTLTVNGTFNLAGFSQAVDSFGGSGLVNLPAGSTLTVGVNGAFSTYSGQLSGPGSFVKAGAGTQIVGTSPGFTGQSTVTGGLLAIGDQALPNSTVVLAGGGLGLGFDTNAVLGALAGTGNTNLGGINFSSLTVGGNNASTTYAGSFLGSAPGGLIKAGTGTWTLTGTNTQTGPFNVQNGLVLVGSTGALSPSAPITVSAGATLDLNGYSYTVTSANALTVQGNMRLGSASVTVATGGTATYNGGTVSNGYLQGAGTQVITGGATLSGVTTYNSTVISVTGAGTLRDFSNGGTLSVAAGLSAVPSLNEFTNQGSGTMTLGANSQMTVVDFQSYGVITIANGTGSTKTLLTNTGTTPSYFNGGSRTFIGTIGGNGLAQLELNGQNAIVAGGLFVNNGHVTDSSAAGISTIIADYGALVKGAGTYDNSPITQNGGKFQAGNSPGVATVGRFVFGPGGVSNYVFAIDDATGQAGPTPDALGHVSGWGLVKSAQWQRAAGSTSGDFAWTADAAHPLSVAIDTLVNPTTVGNDVPGLMADFDPSRSYSWPAVEWTGAYSGPTDVASLDAATNFDTSGIANPIAGSFGWSLDPTGQTLSLNYTPSAVPEPGTLALVGFAAAIGWRRRRITVSSI